jgi:hypothetical protein
MEREVRICDKYLRPEQLCRGQLQDGGGGIMTAEEGRGESETKEADTKSG